MEHEHRHMSYPKMATQATFHCLMGCGLGEVVGIAIATALALNNTNSIILAVSLGAVFGIILGLRPWLKEGYTFSKALKNVLIAEGLSIVVMETAEVLVEVYTPGVMQAGLTDWKLYAGMALALTAGFIAAWPVNYFLAKRGVAHKH